MRFPCFVQGACIAILLCGLSQAALAGNSSDGSNCSNAQIRDAMNKGAASRAQDLANKIAANSRTTPSFNSLYCGAQIKSVFDKIGAGLGGAFYSMISQLITSLANQACAAAIAPIQNAASQLCIPFFNMASFNLSLGLNSSANVCNGTQLISVTPVTSPPAATSNSNSNYSSPSLLP